MTHQPTLIERFRDLATDIAERDFSHVQGNDTIAELGIDSLGILEIIGSLEREFSIKLPDELLSNVQTVDDLLAIIESQRAA